MTPVPPLPSHLTAVQRRKITAWLTSMLVLAAALAVLELGVALWSRRGPRA